MAISKLKKIRSNTLARRRLRELKSYFGSVRAMQHSLFITNGCRVELSCIYGWLSGVGCPDGRIIKLSPPVRWSVNEWIKGYEGVVPSKNKEPFQEPHWWTPVVTNKPKGKQDESP